MKSRTQPTLNIVCAHCQGTGFVPDGRSFGYAATDHLITQVKSECQPCRGTGQRVIAAHHFRSSKHVLFAHPPDPNEKGG